MLCRRLSFAMMAKMENSYIGRRAMMERMENSRRYDGKDGKDGAPT